MGVYDEKPWLALYGDKPAEIDPEFTSGLAMFQAAVEAAGDRTAVQYFDTSLTFADVGRLSDGLALGLKDLGVERGDRVAAYMQNVPQFLVTMVAAWKLGAVLVSANPMYKGRELGTLLNDSGSKVLVCLESLYHSVAAGVVEDGPVREVITTSELDFVEGDVPGPLADSQRDRPSGTHDLLELAARHEGEKPEAVELAGDDVAVPHLHVGHDRPAQGRDEHARQRRPSTPQVYRDWMRVGARRRDASASPRCST